MVAPWCCSTRLAALSDAANLAVALVVVATPVHTFVKKPVTAVSWSMWQRWSSVLQEDAAFLRSGPGELSMLRILDKLTNQ